MMPDLPRDEWLRVQAAEGWLELGMHQEALRELEALPPSSTKHRKVLHVTMNVAYAAKRWSTCLEAATTLIHGKPETAAAHVAASISLYRLARTEEAWQVLLPAMEQFDDDWHVPYNLACYAAQLGWRECALEMFDLALDRGDGRMIKLHALEDPDLKPLWMDIADD